ncbi:hypothetical protein D3C86_1083690 [compost metagenome]
MQENERDVKKAGRDEAFASQKPPTLLEGLGLAESFLSTGRDAGFDMTSEEGVAAWSSEIKRRIMTGQTLEMSLPRTENPQKPSCPSSETQSRGRKPH